MTTIISHARYADETYADLRLDGAELVASEFAGCRFERCSFVEAVLRQCRFVECVFQGCDLSLARLPESVFSAVRFEDSKVVGVNWALVDWSSARLGESLAFVRCALNHATFIGLDLREMQVIDCLAQDVDLRGADLSGADFSGTDLSECLFADTDLSGADLSRARNYHIDPANNTLKGARFSLPEAMSLLFSMDIVLVEDGGGEGNG